MKVKFFVVFASVTLIILVGCHQIDCHKKQIIGIVVKVEYITERLPFGTPPIKNTIVTFKDGRIKVFDGICDIILQKGRTNVITYNLFNKIVSVEIKQ